MLRGTTGNTGTDKDNPVEKLKQEIAQLSEKIGEIQKNLPHPGTEGANTQLFTGYANYFTNISSRFAGYLTDHGPYHKHLHGSSGRKAEANNVVKGAKKIAKLFEKYARKPTTYSRAECFVEMRYLLGNLGNLKRQ